MSAMPPLSSPLATLTYDQFVVSHGKSGGVGVFMADEPLHLRRGQRVLVQTQRGAEIGSVLCPATLLQARLLGATSTGQLLRALTCDDETRLAELDTFAQSIFETGRAWVERDGLPVELLDVDACFDGQRAILQFVGSDGGLEQLALALGQHFGCTILLENLAAPPEPEETHGGCDKPDCGRTAGGACTTCGTGGGCSSCGSGKVDLREYFGPLREKMESTNRISLA